MPFPATEIASLNVGNSQFTEWETVSVRHALKEQPAFSCRFTCSEDAPAAANFGVMRIKPGMDCSVTLAGQPAFKGKVHTRQVFYDAHRHYVELQCASNMDVSTGSVVSENMEWKDKTFEQIARECLSKAKCNLSVVGGSLPNIKLPRVSATHGQTIYDFLDMIARNLSGQTKMGINFTSNPQQDFVCCVGPAGGSDVVVEGGNIIEGREIIYNAAFAGRAPTLSQGTGNNQDWGAKIASLPFFGGSYQTLSSLGGVAQTIISELPTADKSMLQGRASFEGSMNAGDEVTVTVTVYGWLRPSGGLWHIHQYVNVSSPSLIMSNEPLIARAITFTQDNRSGTRTSLELMNPAALKGIPPAISG